MRFFLTYRALKVAGNYRPGRRKMGFNLWFEGAMPSGFSHKYLMLAKLSFALSKHCDLVPNCLMPAVVHSQQASHLDIQIPIVRGEDPLKPHSYFSSKGEKKVKDQSNKTHLIKAYLNDSEYERFNRIAAATNSTNSDLVRRLLQTSVFVEFPPVEYREIIDQLEHIGINLNQLARVAHSLGFIDEPEYRKNANEVWRMVARLAQIYVQVGARINDEICKRKGDIV